jgi:hypothetical protein
VSDIFREVDEEVRREQLKKLWQRYGNYLVALLVVIVAGVGAWRGYSYWEARKAADSGAAFEAATTLADAGKHTEAEAAFAKVAVDGTSGYRNLARMRAAAELAQTDAKAAVGEYEKIAADSRVGPDLQDLAAVRAGALLIDAGNFAEARVRLDPVAGNDRPFRHTARELLVLAATRTNDTALAKRWLDLMMSDPQTPPGTRSRVEILAALSMPETKSEVR